MYTRCPHCDSQQAITMSQIRKKRGLLHCVHCGERFDALATLSEQLSDESAIQTNHSEFWTAKPELAKSAWFWGIGSALLLMGLVAQVAYFDGDKLLGQPILYKAFSNICHRLACQVPVLSNPDDWALSHSDLETHLDHRYLVISAISNQADRAQAFPKLRLTLSDFKGRMLAQRLFESQQYMHETTLAAHGTALIRLPIVLPGQAVGGYSLSLL